MYFFLYQGFNEFHLFLRFRQHSFARSFWRPCSSWLSSLLVGFSFAIFAPFPRIIILINLRTFSRHVDKWNVGGLPEKKWPFCICQLAEHPLASRHYLVVVKNLFPLFLNKQVKCCQMREKTSQFQRWIFFLPKKHKRTKSVGVNSVDQSQQLLRSFQVMH